MASFQQQSEGSRAYDPLTGSFLTPAWKNVLLHYKDLPLYEPLSLWLLYRFPGNDPINAKFNALQGKLRTSFKWILL